MSKIEREREREREGREAEEREGERGEEREEREGEEREGKMSYRYGLMEKTPKQHKGGIP